MFLPYNVFSLLVDFWEFFGSRGSFWFNRYNSNNREDY